MDLSQTQLPDHVPNVEAISQTAQSANPQAHDSSVKLSYSIECSLEEILRTFGKVVLFYRFVTNPTTRSCAKRGSNLANSTIS